MQIYIKIISLKRLGKVLVDRPKLCIVIIYVNLN